MTNNKFYPNKNFLTTYPPLPPSLWFTMKCLASQPILPAPQPPPPPPPPPPAAPPRRLVTVVRNNRTSFCQLDGASPTSPSPSTPTPSPKPRRNETPMDCRDCGHDWEELIADDVSRRQHDDNLLETQPNNQLIRTPTISNGRPCCSDSVGIGRLGSELKLTKGSHTAPIVQFF